METGVVLISFVVLVLAVIALVLLFFRLWMPVNSYDFSGIWLNEAMNIRILLHNDDSSVFQGRVIWANGIDKLLGFNVVQNLKLDLASKSGKGNYFDPLTGKVYEMNLRLKRKGLILISAYHPNSNSLAFSQEWKLFTS